MELITKKYHLVGKLFGGYVIFAGIATIVDIGLLYLLTAFIGLHYLLSAALSYTCGMITNYSLNKVFNFKNKSKFGFFFFEIIFL